MTQEQNQQVVQTLKTKEIENYQRESKDSNLTLKENQKTYQGGVQMNQNKSVQDENIKYHEQ